MTIIELNGKLNQLIEQGQGDRPIYVEGGDGTWEIDSVQKDTHPKIEVNYYFLMAGGRIDESGSEYN